MSVIVVLRRRAHPHPMALVGEPAPTAMLTAAVFVFADGLAISISSGRE
jgi:hypothetical protein